MKYLIALPLLVLFASPAFASDECGSVWLYKPFKTCATGANGLNLNSPSGESTTMSLKSNWMGGGRDQQKVCRDIAEGFNQQNQSKGLHASVARPTPIGEESENRIIAQEYQYTCEMRVQKYALKEGPNPACGAEEKFSYRVGGSSRDLPGTAVTCLSCDNFSDQPPVAMVNCLRDNILNVVEPRAIELRDSDLNAMSAQVKRLLNLTQQMPIENLRTTDQISLFTNFLNKHPVQGSLDRGGGGIGRLPTLQ